MKKDIFEIEYSKLNPSQKEAVDTIYWPVMVVAGPGTWKTQIIWLRTANILVQTGVLPSNILITTFTDAGVVAIKKRLEKFLWSDGYKVSVSTIHSFCQDVMRNFPEKFIAYKASSPIDDVDSLEILKNILTIEVQKKNIEFLTNDFDPFLYLRDIKSRINTLKQEAISPQEFEIIIKKQAEDYQEILSEIKPTLKKYETTKETQEKHIKKLFELNHLYKIYLETLRQEEKYDFSDMIHYVVDVFEKDEEMKYFYAEKYQFIMLDEFQDTNNAQNKIIDLIVSVWEDAPNILVVWDDDQSIYRFQWANIENMLEFSTKFPQTHMIVLENNYRSTQPILDVCSALIENNNERLSKRISGLEKKLISSNAELSSLSNLPILVTPNTKEEQGAYIVSEIKKRLEQKISPEEIAIIVRNNSEVEEFSNFLEQNNIPVTSKLNTDILKNDYVKFIIKFLSCLENTFECDKYFIDIARSSVMWLSQTDIFKINKELYNFNYTKKFKLWLYDYILDLETKQIDLIDKEAILNFRDTFLDLSQKRSELHFIEFFPYFIEKIGIIEYVEKNGNFDDIEDIYTLFNKIKSYVSIKKEFSLENFLTKINLHLSYNYAIPRQILRKSKTWVQVLTAHSSKWLEYEVVFIPNLSTGNWDNKRVIDKLKLPVWIAWAWLQDISDPIEEERRLFFVAASRAKKELIISFPLSSENKIKLASVFLSEIEHKLENKENHFELSWDFFETTIKNILKPKLFEYSSLEFDYIQEFLENYRLSPTDLNVFLEDPMNFLHSVVFRYPFTDNDATIFGKVYHRVLELFYSRYKQTGKMDDVNYLTFTFKVLLEKEVLSPESFEKLLEKWTKGLTGFYDTYKNNVREVLYLEYNFRPKWLSFEWVPLTGKIDKIEKIWLASWGNQDSLGQLAFFKDEIALIDYKTGKPKSLSEIKWVDKNGNKKQWEWKYLRQLMFYKLLCQLDSEFSSKYEIGSLALDFVEGRDGEYKYIEVPYTNEEFEDFKKELLEAWDQISDISFWKELLEK